MQDNMDTINTGEAGTTTTPQQEEKTFTQDQVNAIVGKRLAEEKTKTDADLVQREQELARREYQYAARDTLTKRGHSGESLEILSVLNAKTVDELNKALDIIERHFSLNKESFDAAVQEGINKRLVQKAPETRYIQPSNDVRKAMGIKT